MIGVWLARLGNSTRPVFRFTLPTVHECCYTTTWWGCDGANAIFFHLILRIIHHHRRRIQTIMPRRRRRHTRYRRGNLTKRISTNMLRPRCREGCDVYIYHIRRTAAASGHCVLCRTEMINNPARWTGGWIMRGNNKGKSARATRPDITAAHCPTGIRGAGERIQRSR